MPLPLTVSCFSKTKIGFTFLVPAYLGNPGKRAVKRVCVCVCVSNVAVKALHGSAHIPAAAAAAAAAAGARPGDCIAIRSSSGSDDGGGSLIRE